MEHKPYPQPVSLEEQARGSRVNWQAARPYLQEDWPLPVYLQICYPLATVAPRNYRPGRIFSPGLREHMLFSDAFVDTLGPQDIVYIPLYEGWSEEAGEGTSGPLPEYEQNLAWLNQIAPRVRGILVGNAGPELSFKHVYWGGAGKLAIAERMIQFVEETAPLVLDAGGTPVYAPMDWDLVMDEACARSLFQEFMLKSEFLQIVFSALSLFTGDPASIPRRYPPLPERPPYPRMTEYFQRGRYWGGVGFLEGLLAGNAQVLKDHGCEAAVMGVF